MIIEKEVKTLQVETIICNKCGVRVPVDGEWFHGHYFAGYDSKHFGDGADVSFELCEKCLKEFTDSFKEKIEDKQYMIGEAGSCKLC
jgi:hypothetical protein